MSTNDQILLLEYLAQWQNERQLKYDESTIFELFAADQILKDHELSWDELESGLVDGGDDGGIDSIFLFVNGTLVQEDTDLSGFRGNVAIDFHLIQSKRKPSFSETAIQKFISTSGDLFDFDSDFSSLQSLYNSSVLNAFRLFKETYRLLVSQSPELRINFHYATLGSEIHRKVERLADKLKDVIRKQLPDAECSVNFLGARDLIRMASRKPRTVFELKLAESPIASDRGYVALVYLHDFAKFITSENGTLTTALFEANVRDYQGDVEVNRAIRDTLAKPKGEDFWWLNNGITMVVSRATLTGKTLHLENPQIVNGLQTSIEIFEYFRTGGGDEKENRRILLRVIEPSSEESHQRIIRATNSQTAIPIAFLRATDEIHRDIETFFHSHRMYYERRKNFYKNQGKPRDAIVAIPALAQAVMAVLLGRPNDARGRPSTLLKSDRDYEKVFNTSYPLAVYFKAVEMVKLSEGVLRAHPDQIPAKEVINLKFHLAYIITRRAIGKLDITAQDLERLDRSILDEATVQESFKDVIHTYQQLGANDQVAKSKEFMVELEKLLSERLHSSRASS